MLKHLLIKPFMAFAVCLMVNTSQAEVLVDSHLDVDQLGLSQEEFEDIQDRFYENPLSSDDIDLLELFSESTLDEFLDIVDEELQYELLIQMLTHERFGMTLMEALLHMLPDSSDEDDDTDTSIIGAELSDDGERLTIFAKEIDEQSNVSHYYYPLLLKKEDGKWYLDPAFVSYFFDGLDDDLEDELFLQIDDELTQE